jgi:hypothetical protein
MAQSTTSNYTAQKSGKKVWRRYRACVSSDSAGPDLTMNFFDNGVENTITGERIVTRSTVTGLCRGRLFNARLARTLNKK